MRYTLLVLLTLSLSLSAVELQLSKDSNLSVKQAEIDIVQKAYRGTHSNVNVKKLRVYLKDNRILSDMYLDKHAPLDQEKSIVLKHTIENVLAAKMIKELQEGINISDDIVKSYYIAHQDEYMYKPTYDYLHINFESFEAAANFYLKNSTNIDNIVNLAKETNATIEVFNNKPEDRLYYTVIKKLEKNQPPFILAPQKLEKYTIFVIKAKHKAKPIAYDSVKHSIKELLFQQTATDTRNKLMLEYEKKAK